MADLKLYPGRSREIKASRFYEMVEILNRYELWDDVRRYTDSVSPDVRIRIDTILLNAVKLAVHERLGADIDSAPPVAQYALICDRFRRAAEQDAREQAERDRQMQRETMEMQKRERERREGRPERAERGGGGGGGGGGPANRRERFRGTAGPKSKKGA